MKLMMLFIILVTLVCFDTILSIRHAPVAQSSEKKNNAIVPIVQTHSNQNMKTNTVIPKTEDKPALTKTALVEVKEKSVEKAIKVAPVVSSNESVQDSKKTVLRTTATTEKGDDKEKKKDKKDKKDKNKKKTSDAKTLCISVMVLLSFLLI